MQVGVIGLDVALLVAHPEFAEFTADPPMSFWDARLPPAPSHGRGGARGAEMRSATLAADAALVGSGG